MPVVGLTGGIGSGKSTVASLLADKGAVVIDADRISREVMAPGGAAFGPVVERFGPGVVAPDGTLDRAGLAQIVFNDRDALKDLEGITHPAIGRVMAERMAEAAADPDRVVVMDIPLLAEGTSRERYGLAAVIVVDTPEDLALERLVAQREMDPADARARMANQAGRDERRALADHVIDNSGSLEHLQAEVDRVWAGLQAP
ncbi:MAG TPA: dephospho-CoA kinase [Acidimicrobiales bacterium]|nr:dephospho-CoA kinase [Acidimicrobiales bacterium]